jgi:hypothetical protein
MATANKGVPPKVARATPSLKMQTHYEANKTDMSVSQIKAMWAALYARNKWKPIP